MNRPTRRVATAVFAGFGVLLGFVTWYQVLAVDTYRNDPRNVRTALSESGKERGVIVTRDGTILAQSAPDPDEPTTYLRSYPGGAAFTPVVGYASLLAGSAGIERSFSDELRSRRDFTISDLLAAALGRDLRPRSLQVTIDPALQLRAYQLLKGERGAVVAIDPATGELLAYVSTPSYDPSLFLGPDALVQMQALLDDATGPLFDRAGNTLYAPGSAFKVVVTAAALESGLAGPETEFGDPPTFFLPGSSSTISNFGGGLCGDGVAVTLQTAFVRSCNTIFADLALRLGAETIGEMAAAFRFNDTIALPWQTARSAFPVSRLVNDGAALAQSGIGERDVRVTALQMALVAATVANGGEMMKPMVVRQIFDADGQTVRVFEPDPDRLVLSPAAAAALTDLMERVVTTGTGSRASVAGMRVAGKTGTAQGSGGAPDVWFIGFAPVESPTIALAVVIEEGGIAGEEGTGGSIAAPIAADLLKTWLQR